MRIYLYDTPDEVTQEGLHSALMQLPFWRSEQVLRYRFLLDRVLCAKAYLLLKEGLMDMYGIVDHPSFIYTGNNKPILYEYPNIHFNMSHCNRGVLCAIDNKAIGCDIEEIKDELDIDLVHHCFNEQEVEQILTASTPCVEFTKLWTEKEAILKLTGEGLSDNLPTLLTPELRDAITLTSHISPFKRYVYTICQFN